MRPVLTAVLTALLALPAAAPARAAEFQPVDSIKEAAIRAVVGADTEGVRAEAALDAALRLPKCAQPLEATTNAGGTAEVGCPGAGWRLYVPVRVQRFQPVLVLTRSVTAGTPLDASLVAIEKRDVARLGAGTLADPAQAVGRVARRPLGAGSVLSPQDLSSPAAVRRGDAVTLVARSGPIEVRAAGRALGEAGIDDRVTVENLASRRIIQGVVRGNGEIEVLR